MNQPTTNMRAFIGHTEGYHTINREERNLAAIFYHVLLLGDNLQRFVDLLGCAFPTKEKEVGIYFEYAYIRDLWSSIDYKAGFDKKKSNEFKRTLILDLLQPVNREYLEDLSVEAFNSYFGTVPKASKEFIMSPSNWSMQHYNKEIIANDEFLKVCRFKWCFNAKPDIVIHTTHETAICIEAKFESGEGRYPGSSTEQGIFRERGMMPEGQLSIQRKILREILGLEAEFVYLVQNRGAAANGCSTVTWKEVFEAMDTSACPYFIQEWVRRIKS